MVQNEARNRELRNMPRPKSELTGLRPRTLVARLTKEQHETFLRIGGSTWVRRMLDKEVFIEREKKMKEYETKYKIK